MDPVMHKKFTRILVQLAFAISLTFGLAATASADNVPGSAKEATGYITAATFLDPNVSFEDGMMKSFLAEGMATSDGGVSMIGALSWRNIDEAGALNYDLYVASLLLAYHVSDRTLVFGGLTGETGDGVTPPDDGTISHSAFGAVIGVDYAVNDRFYLTAMAGKMALDYDITRGGGAISASFGADRTYLTVNGEYRIEAASSTTVITGGLRYVVQDDEGYTENGGGVVDPATGKTLSVVFGSRTALEVASDFKPFIETDLRYDISQDIAPYAVDQLPDGRMQARLGVGVSRDTANSTFEAGLGTNFGENGYNGLDAKLRMTLRF
jgi:Autotransporter beta-domain